MKRKASVLLMALLISSNIAYGQELSMFLVCF